MAKRHNRDWSKVDGIADPEVSTSTIAKRLGCSHEAVRAARRKLGCAHPSFVKGIDWDSVPDLMDGFSSATAIASRLGVHPQAVVNARRARGWLSGLTRRTRRSAGRHRSLGESLFTRETLKLLMTWVP